MANIPQSYQHNVSLLMDQRTSDTSRMCDIGADAIGAARKALGSMPADVPIGDFLDDPKPYLDLLDAVKARAVLMPHFADIVDAVIEELIELADEDPIAQALASAKVHLQEAKYYSNRFLDLLAAENQRAKTRRPH